MNLNDQCLKQPPPKAWRCQFGDRVVTCSGILLRNMDPEKVRVAVTATLCATLYLVPLTYTSSRVFVLLGKVSRVQ